VHINDVVTLLIINLCVDGSIAVFMSLHSQTAANPVETEESLENLFCDWCETIRYVREGSQWVCPRDCLDTTTRFTVEDGLFEQVKGKLIDLLLGNSYGFTLIGSAEVIKEVEQDPDRIEFFAEDTAK